MKENIGTQNPSIGVVTVATNIYVDYWMALVESSRLFVEDENVTFYVFTDSPNVIDEFKKNIDFVKIKSFKIPKYRWPEATLFRYQIISEHFTDIQSDIIVHLDADSLFVNNPWEEFRLEVSKGISLVGHPGYWRPDWKKRLKLYLLYPKILVNDLYLRIVNGGEGTWERNKCSSAFTPRALRKKYVCGGTWFGYRDSIARMVDELALNVKNDYVKNVVANWHDESHLNFWASKNAYNLCNPKFCFDNSHSNLIDIHPIIVAVRKNKLTR